MRITPISQQELIRRLRQLGWEGPDFRGDHPCMAKGKRVQKIPNPHGRDISVDLLRQILRQANISRDEWLEND
jgi:predicted RNA binding protein YcfA (HicA-like mRNA interferase family)